MLALFDSGRLRRPLSRREREVTSGRETKAAGGKVEIGREKELGWGGKREGREGN